MGLLVEGQWVDQWYDTKASKGKFIRSESEFRHWIYPTNQCDPNNPSHFPAHAGRYHLYVSLACPWAHRALIFIQLKQLENLISVSCVHPDMLTHGWELKQDDRFTDAHTDMGDPIHYFHFAHQLYTKAKPAYSGRVTVPILWDKQDHTIVSNESSDIIRILNRAFNDLTGNTLDFYPAEKADAIDTLNERIYHTLNNGVYKCGFATTQEAYEEALTPLFDTLDFLEATLDAQSYLLGETQTEADWRLFTTLVRFDAVYFGHFKCNLKRIIDYPKLNAYMKRLYHTPNIAKTVNIQHIKRHYYYSHKNINPTQIIPAGPSTLF
ncbi:glutathione S-transferase family protein [Marinomonas sp. IMCC 4694]|uniref:glutathione S-transferase family protein n=1 Tax=Marinomonas sp. IMCC 4694 TaxID=2605432 RepID=UPI0011E82377|nr:glutathione S-transferase family protein [Marinomonas sp. IMCC 4694]TYL47198.1 glutathione S-transferase family protein [Marinomonas sp. IMCC 4694]